mmetsp:Transcript_12317/g.25219  ORF Transcript_12317/g.25219 Transcript_12317/m.25219 type:complete len:339 (-) Transcript_12317:47-1063(-)
MLEKTHKVVIYTKANCAACARAKRTLGWSHDGSNSYEGGLNILRPNHGQALGVKINEVIVVELDLSKKHDAAEFDRLAMISGRRTVPVCFINGIYVGGGDDMARMGGDGSLLLHLTSANSITMEEALDYVRKNGSPSIPPNSSLSPPPPPTTSASSPPNAPSSSIDYTALHSEVSMLISDEDDLYANAANISSAVYHAILSSRGPNGCNWCGFYFARDCIDSDERILLLGPFVGKPACRRIQFSEGVCGAAARTQKTQLVPDVHKFPGHIACDSASNSELVIPLLSQTGKLLGVFDLDCPVHNGYNEEDATELGKICKSLIEKSVFPTVPIAKGVIKH